MLGTRLTRFTTVASSYTTPTTTPGVAITPGSGVKGSWATVLSAIPGEAHVVEIRFVAGNTNAAARNILVDIGIDPSGGTNFTTLIPNLIASQASNFVDIGIMYTFPLLIPAGASIGARAASNSTSTVRVAMRLMRSDYRGAFDYGTQVVQIGTASESTGTGVSFTPGNTGAEGSWTTLGNLGTGGVCKFITFGVGINNSTTTSLMYYIDLRVGGVMVLENVPLILPGTNEKLGYVMPLLSGFVYIPANGQNVDIRGSCSGTAVTGFNALGYAVF